MILKTIAIMIILAITIIITIILPIIATITIKTNNNDNNNHSNDDDDHNNNDLSWAQIEYEESADMADALFDMYGDVGQASGVHDLRDKHGADLVQMIGFFTSSCGIG